VRRDERGAGTVVVLAVAAVVVLLALAIAALGAAQRARGAAQAAADLGALAAAGALRHGIDPCTTAAVAVDRNGAVMSECEPEGVGVVRVAAVRAVGPQAAWAGLAAGQARAEARAGPRSAISSGLPS
jgi:secretion/DNA translocation related TadE-like protein